MSLSTKQYDLLEAAIEKGSRVAVRRPTYELVFIPERIVARRGGEWVEGRHPVTGAPLELPLDALGAFDVVR
jgi:hypothetical protein